MSGNMGNATTSDLPMLYREIRAASQRQQRSRHRYGNSANFPEPFSARALHDGARLGRNLLAVSVRDQPGAALGLRTAMRASLIRSSSWESEISSGEPFDHRHLRFDKWETL